MNRSQSLRKFPSDEGAEFAEDKRATSHPNLSASLNTAELRGSRHQSAEELRRKLVRLNKELETEKAFVKQLKREKSLDLKHAREEEQRRAASMQTELKTKLHREKANELSALKEQLHKDKEKEIVHIIKQKDDVLRSAQQIWAKEKDELRGKIRGEVWSEARDESRKEFDRERTRLEQEILDLKMQKKELEEAYKILQEADKRKADEIRRIFHEHEVELEKFKRNSWQESRRQMGEIRQLLNIIEQLERKLGIDSGHINKLRMEKEGLYEELRKKTNTFDAWDSMMSSSVKAEGSTSGQATIPPPYTDPKYHGVSHEIRTLQRKNTELSSLVKKLDEKNQQLATKNAELLSELERNDKEARDKCKKLEKKNLEITQNTKKLESKNKALQEEINTLKRKPGPASSGKDVSGKKAAVRPRGQGMSQTDGPEIATLKQQIKEQSKTIEELKQNLMEKERRIDLLKQRKKSGKKPKLGRTSVDVVLQQEHDDAASGFSDVSSDISEMSSTDSSSDASKLKKLTKELLALERAYALLQAQVGGTVDVERDEMERQQLQSDLIESQTRIHELERMMDNNAQGGSEDLQQLQHDNKILYQKLIAAENERDRAFNELSKNTEDLKDLQDKKDLLEFELEEMSQMSFAGSEDEFASPRKMRDKEDRKLPLSLEEVKAYLEDIENEKANALTVMEIEALKQARTSLTAFPQKISRLEATEAVLRSKVKDLEERHLLDNQGPMQYDSHMGEPETLSEVLELDAAANKDQTDSTQNNTDFILLDIDQHFKDKELIDKECETELTCTLLCDMEHIYDKFLRDHKQEAETLYHKPIITFDTEKSDAECMTDFEWRDHKRESESLFHTPIITFDTEKSDAECMTEFIWEDIVEIEETYEEFLTNIEGLELNLAKAGVKMADKRTATDLICNDITALENKGKQLDQLQETLSKEKIVEKREQESNTEFIEKHEVECNTDLTCGDMIEKEHNSRVIMLKAERLEKEVSKTFCDKNDVEIMTDIQWKDVVKQEEVYKEKIVELQNLLVVEQEHRKEDEMKLVEYKALKEANAAKKTAELSIMTDSVWIEERMVQDLVAKTTNDAVAEISGEAIDDLQHCLLERLSVCQEDQQTGTDITGEYIKTLLTSNTLVNTSELTRLREVIEERENRLKELQEELANILVGKDELETMTDLMREEFTEREEMYKSQIDELHKSLSTERQLRQNNKMKLLEYEALKEADKNSVCEDKSSMTDMVWVEDSDEALERTAREIVVRVMNKAMMEVANDIICDLQRRSMITDISDMETDMDQLNEDKSSMTDMVWVEDSDEVLERTAREIVVRSMNKAMMEVANDTRDQRNRPVVTKSDKETMTDILGEDVQKLEKDNQSNILELARMTEVIGQNELTLGELGNELSKVLSERKKLEVMIDMIRKDVSEKDKLHEEQAKKLQEQIRIDQGTREADKMKLAEYEILKEKIYDDKIVMTESVWIVGPEEIVERMVKQMVEEAKNEAFVEVAKEDLKEIIQTGIREMEVLREAVKDRERRLNELETELSESKTRENELQDATNHLREELSKVEQLQDQIEEVKEQLTMDQDIIVELRDKNCHLKDEEDAATVDEIQSREKDVMIDMSCTEVMEIQEKIAKVDVKKNEVEVMTDVVWEDFCNQEQLYKEQMEEMQKQLIVERDLREAEKLRHLEYEAFKESSVAIPGEEKGVMTDNVCIKTTEEVLGDIVREVTKDAVNKAAAELADEELHDIMENEILRQSRFKENEQKLAELESKLSRSENELQLLTEQLKEDADIREHQEQFYKEKITTLQEQLMMEHDLREHEEMKFMESEVLKQKEQTVPTEDKNNLTNEVGIEEAPEVLEKMTQELVEKCKDQAMGEVLMEAVAMMAEMLTFPRADKQTMTDITSNDIENLEVNCQDSLKEMAKMKDADEPKEQMIQELQDDISRSTVTKTEVCVLTEMNDLENTRQQIECSVKCDKNIMTDMSWIEVMEVEENYETFRDNIQQIKEKLAKVDVEKKDVEIMTDVVWQVVYNQEKLYNEKIEEMQEQLIVELETREKLQEKLARVDVEKDEVEIMTDVVWEDFCNQEQLYKEQMEEMQEQLMLEQVMREDYKMRLLEYEALRESSLDVQGEDKIVMTESVCIKTPKEELQSVVVELAEKAKHEAIVELAAEAALDVTKEDKYTMTEFSWKEIEYLEKTYREWVKELRQMKEDLRRQQQEKHDKSCMTEIPPRNTTDAKMMTELEWSEIVHLENSYNIQVLELQALKDNKENQGTTEEKITMTELKWEDILYLETSYTEKIQELEVIAEGIKDVEHGGSRDGAVNKQSMTDLSWQDVDHLEESYQEELEKLEVLASFFNENEKEGRDQEVMTEFKWDEVECQLESYKNQIDHMNGLLEDKRYREESLLTETMADELQGENMGQLQMSLDFETMEDMDERMKVAESMTEITLKDMFSMETKLNSFAEEGEDKECMTELSHEDISAMEDVVMKQTERLENEVGESYMTDLLFDDIERLQKLEQQQLTDTKDNEHVQTNISSGDLERGQDKKELEQGQFYRITDDDERHNAEDTLEPTEPRTSTRLKEFPFTEGLDDNLTREDSSLSRNADLIEQYTSTDITLEDILYFEDLEIKHHELLLKTKQQGTRSSVDGSSRAVDNNGKLIGMEKTDQETSTDLTLADLSYYENLEVEYHEMTSEKKKKKQNQLEGGGMPSRGPSSTEEGRTTVDIEEFENLKRKYEQILDEKERRGAEGSAPEMTSIDVRDYENLNEKYNNLLLEKEQWEAVQAEQGLTSVDQEDYENVKEQLNEMKMEREKWESAQEDYENMKEQMNELLLEKEQWEGEQEDYESIKEQLNEMMMEREKWESAQQDYENMKEQMNELLLEKEQWECEQEDYESIKEQLNEMMMVREKWESAQEDYENMKEQMNELLLEKEQWEGEQKNYENMKEQLNEMMMEREQWEAAQNKQQQTSVDVKEYENMKKQLFQLLSEKEQRNAVQSDQQDNETLKEKYNEFLIEKERLEAAQDDYENMKEQFNELLMEKEQWETARSKMGLGPDDRKEYENLKERYNELVSEKEQLEAATLQGSMDLNSNQNIKNEVGTSTDLKLDDLEYYENVELDYRDLQESHQQLTQEYDAMCSGKNSTDKATGTDLSLDDIQCLRDAENKYKNLLLTRTHEGEDQGVCTDMTMGRLQYLEEVESIHKMCGPGKSTHVGTTTDLALADLHYLEEVEAVHQQCMTTVDNDISSSRTDTSDMGVGTELTASVLEYLEEVAVAHKEIVREYEAFRRSVTKEKEDANLMTEMTGRHLDSLQHVAAKNEELEMIALQIAEEKRVRKERKRDSTLMTELTLENLKNLETSGNIFTELRDRGILWRMEQLLKPKQKYSTVADFLVSSIEYLEDIERLYREQERIRNNMREKSVETDMTQTDLKRMENLANNAVDSKKKTAEKVTAQTSQQLLESSYPGVNGRHGDRNRRGHARGVGTVEIGIQCELNDLLSIIREQHERDGGSADTRWFFSELNKKSKEGFEPVEVVLRHGVQNSSTPDVTSRRDHGNKRYSLDSKRHSSNMSLNLDYGWTSTSSLDISGIDKTPLRGSYLGRLDSPRVPLAQDETFDLSDIESAPSEESLQQEMQATGRGESAVKQFDRYIMARKQSEKELLADIRENEDQEDAGERPNQPKSMAELLKENERLKIRNTELELLVAQKGDLSEDELQLLKQKIQQLREAEEQMEKLHDSNAALKHRINQLQEENLQSGPSTSRSAGDNWSEMDPSEGRTRLLLVQDWGLGESDLDSLFSAREGAVSPAESIETAALRRLLDEYAKSDHAAQAGPVPGVSQEIQTTGDMVKLIDLSYDGTIPDHIAKELEKLKAENRELYQELLELRKLKLANSAASHQRSRDSRLEEPIKASAQLKAESQDDWLTKLESLSDGWSTKRRNDGKEPKAPVKDFDELFAEPAPKPKGAHKQYPTRRKVKEPEVRSSRSPRDTKAALQRGLSNLESMDGQQDIRQRADTDDILDFEFADDAPPDFAPPPVPSEPSPDLPDKNQDNIDLGTEPILGTSPPRDSKALRAALRQKNYPGGIAAVSEPNVQADEEASVEGQPGLERTEIPPALRTNQTSYLLKPPATIKPVPPPTLPKPKMTGRRVPGTPKSGLLSTPLTRSRESLNDEEGLGLTPRGYVRATASAINQGELDALGEKIHFLEKQLKNKENLIRSMKAEASELEKQALLERREREIKILEEDVAFLKQENHKKERELLTKIGELNRKSYEADQWKVEANNAEKQRKRIEASYLNLQAQTRSLQGSDSKLSGLQSKYSTLEKENNQLSEKVKNLEKTEKEFKQLEYNISVLQNHLQDMESVEKERDDLLKKLKIVEDQRDDLLKKGRMVESERNDFLRNNKIMEMQRDELEQRYAMAHKNQMELEAVAEEMEGKFHDANNKTLDAQHERNFVQAQYNKLEAEKNELEKRLVAVTQERNALETRLAELEDRSREYIKLEDGFHTLRLKAAELTRQRDDFEMQIPTLKAKLALIKKACKEKGEVIDKLNDEIRELRHAIATSTLDDLSKIRSYGYSPENFVKYSGKRDESKKDVTNGTGVAVDSKSRSNATRSPCRSKSINPPPKMFVAIFDYDPHKASVSGCPELELTLKEGNELMVYGDMDSNGCYEAELNGVRGLVPGLYVEEVEDGPVHSLANGTNGHEKERAAKGRPTNENTEPDAISSSHSSMSPRSSCPDTELQRQCFVALYDYNPYQSCTTGRPELELPLKKGDIMTVIGDMDVNRYYKAEMDGLTGLVPSNFVEDVTSSSFLQPTSTTAPQQILGMLDNIKVPSPPRSAMSLPLPIPALPNAGPSFPIQPTPTSIVPSGYMGQPIPTVTMISPRREQAIQPIFTPYMSPAEVHKLAAPISTASNKLRAKTSQRSPRQQTATSAGSRGITSQSSPSKHPIPSQPMTSPPQITSQVQQSSVQPVSKPKPRQSKALVTSSQSVGNRGPPDPPSRLRVLRPVNHDAILLGWSLPEMDEFGRSNGVVVKGYKIYENGEYKMIVRSQFMTKALVDDLDLRYPIQFTIRTIGSDGYHSSDVFTTFTDTINNSRMSVSKAIEDTVGNNKQVRIYVALYDYDPMKSSPNSNPQYELKFNEGDILRVEDTSRKDGFYFGYLEDKKGLIPSNFVEEVAVAKALGPPSPTGKGGSRAITNGNMHGTLTPSPTPRHRKKMVALYDYNPSEQSPLDNHHDELSFKKGREITIIGAMNKDGYYNAEINGRRGLVPASFLESPHDATNVANKKFQS